MEASSNSTVIGPAAPAEIRAIASNLYAFNASKIGPFKVRPLAWVSIEGGQLSAGLLAQTSVEWLQAEMLWVSALKALLARAKS